MPGLALLLFVLNAAPPPKDAGVADAGADLSDEEFAKAFGKARGKSGAERGKAVYVPPPPGAGAPPQLESLKPEHIKSVVTAAKADIELCAQSQLNRQKGKTLLTMKWTIRPDGKVASVEVVTEELKRSPVAACVTRLIKRWTFPKHTVQGEPVVFPFKF